MPWLSPSAAVRALHIAPRTLRERAQRGTLQRNERGEYFVDAVEDVSVVGDIDVTPPATPTSARTIDPVAPIEHDDEGGAYVYDESRDRYIFSLRSKAQAGKPFVRSGEDIRAIVLAYSKDGSDATLNEISRTFGLHRATVREVLRALGRTHDSAPFTDEEIASRPEEELVEDITRLKEERILRKAERISWEETKKLADKAKNFNKFVGDKLAAIVAGNGVPKFPAIVRTRSLPDRVAVFCTPSDLHYGKKGWKDEVGQEYDRDICTRRLLTTTDVMLDRVSKFTGKPKRFIVGAGSDWFHVDNEQNGGSTTKGTPQDTDGTWARIFLEGSELAAAYVDRLRRVAPVTIECMSGNHDKLSSLMLTAWLKERFRGNTDVDVRVSPAPRHYLEVGQTLVGITHGDDCKDEKLGSLMSSEAREAWGRTRHRLWFTGHWHSAITNESFGVRVIHCPSLSGSDVWHARNGYVNNRKALSAYVIDEDEGLIADLPVSARGA